MDPGQPAAHLSAIAEARGVSSATLDLYAQDISRLVRACLDRFELVGRDPDSLTLVDVAQQLTLREQYVRPRTVNRDRSALAWFSRPGSSTDQLGPLFQGHLVGSQVAPTPRAQSTLAAVKRLLARLAIDKAPADEVLLQPARRRREAGLGLLMDAISTTLRLDPAAADGDREDLARRLAGVAIHQGRGSRAGAKEIAPGLLQRLLAHLQASARRRTAAGRNIPNLARTFAQATYLTGLRPAEWPTSQLLVDSGPGGPIPIVQAPGWGDREQVKLLLQANPQLYCVNAKESAVTACGPWRRLGLRQLSQADVAVVLAASMLARDLANDWGRIVENASLTIRRAVEELSPGHPPVTLYTFRHDFAHRARERFTPIEVAALMGHISPATNRHYGTRRKASSGGSGGSTVQPAGLPEPDPMNVAMVEAYLPRQAPPAPHSLPGEGIR